MFMERLKKHLIVVCLLSLSMVSHAQIQVSYALNTPTFTLAHENTDKFETLDSAYLDITYLLKYRANEKDDTLSAEDLMDLQVGSKYHAFFSKNLRELDSLNTESLKTSMQFRPVPKDYIGWDILANHATEKEKVTNRVPYTTQVIEYEEETPKITWNYLDGDTATVLGYLCHAAQCTYGGRTWKVYYTPQIPLPYGPWKLNGAKALILKAIDESRDFVFEAVGVTQQVQPIIRYAWNRKVMSKEAWLKYEQNMYKNAGAFVRNTGARIIVMDNSEQGFHRLNEDWVQYYNPLEK